MCVSRLSLFSFPAYRMLSVCVFFFACCCHAVFAFLSPTVGFDCVLHDCKVSHDVQFCSFTRGKMFCYQLKLFCTFPRCSLLWQSCTFSDSLFSTVVGLTFSRNFLFFLRIWHGEIDGKGPGYQRVLALYAIFNRGNTEGTNSLKFCV